MSQVSLVPPLTGQPAPMLDCPFHEEILPNVQSKHPLGQHETIPSCLSFVTKEKEINSFLSVTSFQVVAESSEVFPYLRNVQIKQLQFLHWLLTTLIF